MINNRREACWTQLVDAPQQQKRDFSGTVRSVGQLVAAQNESEFVLAASSETESLGLALISCSRRILARAVLVDVVERLLVIDVLASLYAALVSVA